MYVEMNIPDTILNMDASACNTNVQQQADEDTVEVSTPSIITLVAYS